MRGGQAGHRSSLKFLNRRAPRKAAPVNATNFSTLKSGKFPSWTVLLVVPQNGRVFHESTGTPETWIHHECSRLQSKHALGFLSRRRTCAHRHWPVREPEGRRHLAALPASRGRSPMQPFTA